MTWRPLRDPNGPEPRPVAESLDTVARRLGGGRAKAMGMVWSKWEAIVGQEFAGHAKPISLREGVLVVGVDHPAWATQLRFYSAEIMSRMAELGGEGAPVEIVVKVLGDTGAERSRGAPTAWRRP